MSAFQKILCTLFSCYLRFEIRPFPLSRHVLLNCLSNFKLFSMVLANSFTALVSRNLCSPFQPHLFSFITRNKKMTSV